MTQFPDWRFPASLQKGSTFDAQQRREGASIYKYYTVFNGYAQNPQTGLTYEDRIGPPDVLSSGVGKVAIGFAYLEDTVDASIAALLGTDERAAIIVMAEMSFKAKVHVLGSLVRERASSRTFNCGSADPTAVFREMVSLLFRAEDLRNQITHSAWSAIPDMDQAGSNLRATLWRRKTTAKAKQGLKVATQSMSGGDLLDVYDFMVNVEYELDLFFIDDRLYDHKQSSL